MPSDPKLQRLGCKCAEPEYCFNIYHDGEYKEHDVDVEICQAVTELKPDSALLRFKQLDEVPTAVCLYHRGPYSTLGNTYAEVFRYMEGNGYTVAGNPRESYIDGIWNRETKTTG